MLLRVAFIVNVWHCVCAFCSYKEQSEGSTDEEDLIDASEPADDAASQDESNAETIEKVIRHRIGRKGGSLLIASSMQLHASDIKLLN